MGFRANTNQDREGSRNMLQGKYSYKLKEKKTVLAPAVGEV